MDAVHSTRVLPTSISTEPSAVQQVIGGDLERPELIRLPLVATRV